jgi:2-oxoisovalerate dehydrogenase E1 component beta subunit
MAGEIAATVCEEAFEDLDGPILRVTALDTPVPYSPPLEERFLPNVNDIVRAARDLARY